MRSADLGDSHALQMITTHGLFSTGAYWNNYFYLATVHGGMTAYQVNAASSQLTQAAASVGTYGFPGGSPSVAAAGTAGGVVFGMDTSQYCTTQSKACGPALLHAYNAMNVASEIWNSSMVSANGGGYRSNSPPTIPEVYIEATMGVYPPRKEIEKRNDEKKQKNGQPTTKTTQNPEKTQNPTPTS